eukprot:TRINITY_DN14450_c0_g1_i1.p1 TRINITY_DN14450_c0_g1~~TRINITY_DN14450_c0_g1_i1.p1  ORF type:complete len:274 (-),score=74.31 TRINITY_DN14450_c0_g1_i1:168-989(-)
MCGTGTLLVEACVGWSGGIYIGMDDASEQLGMAATNVNKLRQSHPDQQYSAIATNVDIELLLGNVKRMALRSNSIDCIVCDVPFGRKQHFGGDGALLTLYEFALAEMHRVVRSDGKGRAVLLTSREQLLETAVANSVAAPPQMQWRIDKRIFVKLGALEAYIFVLVKPQSTTHTTAATSTAPASTTRTNTKRKREDALDRLCLGSGDDDDDDDCEGSDSSQQEDDEDQEEEEEAKTTSAMKPSTSSSSGGAGGARTTMLTQLLYFQQQQQSHN